MQVSYLLRICYQVRFYASAIVQSKIEFDVIFGPAYKGIPLASGIASALWSYYRIDKMYSYNRKETKDHGEVIADFFFSFNSKGGLFVGADLCGKKVLIVDDVITAGTAIRDSMNQLKCANALVVGVVVALDREEIASLSADGERMSAIQVLLNACCFYSLLAC